jgi:hypothetical protein
MTGSTISRNKPMERRVRGMYFNIVLSFIFYNITNIRNVFHNSYCFGKYFRKNMHSKFERQERGIVHQLYGYVPYSVHKEKVVPP